MPNSAFIVRPYNMTLTSGSGSAPTGPQNLNDDYKGHYWLGADTTFLQADLGSSLPVDFVSMLHVFCDAATTIRVRAKDSSSVTTSPAYDSTAGPLVYSGTPLNFEGRYHSFNSFSAQTLRYWRVDVANNVLGFTAASRLIIGKKLETTFNYSYGSGLGVRWLGESEFTPEGGQFYRPGNKLRSVTLSYTATTQDEIHTKVMPFFEAPTVAQNHLAICLDPTPSASRQSKFFYGVPTSDFGTIQRWKDGWEWKLTVEGRY